MAADVDIVVRNCAGCARINPKFRHRRHMQLFPPSGPFVFIAMNIVGPFSKTVQKNRYITVITDRYSNLTRAVTTPELTATYIVSLSMNNWPIQYEISMYLMTDSNTQFVCTFFTTVCAIL